MSKTLCHQCHGLGCWTCKGEGFLSPPEKTHQCYCEPGQESLVKITTLGQGPQGQIVTVEVPHCETCGWVGDYTPLSTPPTPSTP
jgi:hypothetical protein